MPPSSPTIRNTRRRLRYACERCRRQKLKCYFATNTSVACIRCVEHNEECSGRDPDELRLHQEKLGGPSILRTLLWARKKIESLEETPLRRSIAAGIYTQEEAENKYHLFKSSIDIYILQNIDSDSILNLDLNFPQLAIAIVTVVAMSTSLSDRQKEDSCEFFLGQIWERSRIENSLDVFLALSVLCAYRLPYGELGVSHLFAFHGVMATLTCTSSLSADELDFVKRIYMCVMAPYAFLDSFLPITRLIDVGHILSGNNSALHLQQAYYDFTNAIRGMSEVENVHDAVEKYEEAMSIILTLLCHNHEAGALRILFFLAKIKLMKAVAVKVATFTGPEGLEGHSQVFLQRIVAEANLLGFELPDLFNRYVSRTVFPTFVLYLIEDCLVNFLAMRFISFAARVNVDVRTEDFLRSIESLWLELARESYTARESFVSFMTARVLSGIKIGVLNKSTGIIGGRGTIPYFEIYVELPESNSLELAGRCTSLEAHNILSSVISGSDIHTSQIDPNVSLTDAGYSFLYEILRIYMN